MNLKNEQVVAEVYRIGRQDGPDNLIQKVAVLLGIDRKQVIAAMKEEMARIKNKK